MVGVSQMRRFSHRKRFAHRPIGQTHDFRAQFFFFCKNLFVQLVLHERSWQRFTWHATHLALPSRFVEKDVFAEIFCVNESEVAFGTDVLHHAKPFALDVERFGRLVVVTFHGPVGRLRVSRRLND